MAEKLDQKVGERVKSSFDLCLIRIFKGVSLTLEVHKGTVHVESDSEKGSIFKFLLSLR